MLLRPAAVVAALLLIASCSSDGERTRPTLPSRTTVAVTEPGATTPPVTEPPAAETTSAPPATEPGATEPSVTEPGATVPATPAPTAAPTTAAPVTNPPVTNPPETAPPATSPVTEPPAPETTVPETTVPETTVPETTVVGDADGDGGSTSWWQWLLAAAILLGGIIALVLRRRGPAWPERVTPVLQEIDALAGRLSVHTPDGLRAVATNEAAALAGARSRLAELVASAPDAAAQATLDTLTTPLADLHTAVGAVSLAATTPSAEEHQGVIRAAAVLHTTSATARVTLFPPTSPGT